MVQQDDLMETSQQVKKEWLEDKTKVDVIDSQKGVFTEGKAYRVTTNTVDTKE